MFNIEEQLKMLPDKPGVYIMHDVDDKIIYVGKAVNLKRRVKSYFRKTDKTERIKRMVSLIDHFEYIVVDNEAEALILECNLIKKNRPKFNVLLKDDKTYPYIKINVKADYPDLYITRRILNDGAKYFGPYANAGSAKEMIDMLNNYKGAKGKKYKSDYFTIRGWVKDKYYENLQKNGYRLKMQNPEPSGSTEGTGFRDTL